MILLTSGVQLAHLWQIVEEQKLNRTSGAALARTVIASIGPTTSEELTRRGLTADLQASHPKMGILATESRGAVCRPVGGKATRGPLNQLSIAGAVIPDASRLSLRNPAGCKYIALRRAHMTVLFSSTSDFGSASGSDEAAMKATQLNLPLDNEIGTFCTAVP